MGDKVCTNGIVKIDIIMSVTPRSRYNPRLLQFVMIRLLSYYARGLALSSPVRLTLPIRWIDTGFIPLTMQRLPQQEMSARKDWTD